MEQTNEELQLRIRELEKEIAKLHTQIKKERYGLVWLDVPEGFERESENQIPVLEEVKDKAIKNDDGKPTHIIIEGDNYHVLTCLNYTHKGKIDVIYIDPPYNTGSDGFTYKDKRFLKEFPDGSPVPKDHPLRHSYWLSFMSKRLELAKNLLSDKGVIFISIDDNEQANLKLLCDKIFGEDKFVAIFPWRKRTAKSDVPYGVSQDYEWGICYANKNFYAATQGKERKYYLTDDFPEKPWRIHDMTTQRSATERPNCFFTIINPKNKQKFPCNPNRVWANNAETFQEYYKQNRIVFPGDYDFLNITKPVLRYWKEEDEKKANGNFGQVAATTFLPQEVGMTQDGTKEITDLFGDKKFLFPKPTSIILYYLKIATTRNQSSIILDFFAGSGTTLHATMKLNAEDGGNRQCILVQQKEGDKNICESVTYERNKRVINGYTNAKGETVEGLGNSLKYYKTAFVGKHPAKSASDDDKIQLSLRAGCLLALAENTLEEIETTNCFQIFSDGNRHFTGVYFTGKAAEIPTFAQKLEALRDENRRNKISAYFFCWGDSEQFEDEFTSLERISLKPMPKPILDIYQSINN
ncbi:MAG: site-specific DNA-methyltransferase [Bacteroidales bacterium]|nr:site-specific DNA-methyltransferase [Bacteroidales bacterium]